MSEYITSEKAEAKGYAKFNNVPHHLVDVPDGNSTITCRMSDGTKVTFAFLAYTTGGVPKCVDICEHHEEMMDFPGGRHPEQKVVVFNGGRGSQRVSGSLVTLLLHNES